MFACSPLITCFRLDSPQAAAHRKRERKYAGIVKRRNEGAARGGQVKLGRGMAAQASRCQQASEPVTGALLKGCTSATRQQQLLPLLASNN